MQLSNELRTHFGLDRYDIDFAPTHICSKLAPILEKTHLTYDLSNIVASYAAPSKIQRIQFQESKIYPKRPGFFVSRNYPSDYMVRFGNKRDFLLVDMRDIVIKINSADDCVNNCIKYRDECNEYDGCIFRYDIQYHISGVNDYIDAIVGFKTKCMPRNGLELCGTILPSPFYDIECTCEHHRYYDNARAIHWTFANCAHPILVSVAPYSPFVFPVGMVDVVIFKSNILNTLCQSYEDAINNTSCSSGILLQSRSV